MGRKYLTSGVRASLRLGENEPAGEPKPLSRQVHGRDEVTETS